MAKLSIKPPKKVQTIRNPLVADEKFTGGEVIWNKEEDAKLSDYDFDHKLRRAFYYYNYYFSQKDLRKYVAQWLQAETTISAADLSRYLKTTEKATPMTVCSLCRAASAGMPFKDKHYQYVVDEVRKVIDAQVDDIVPKKDAKVEMRKPTIQDRLAEKLGEVIGHFEGLYDELIQGADAVNPNAYSHLQAEKVPQAQIGKIAAFYEQRKVELATAEEGADKQLKEAYAHYKKKDFKKYVTFINALLKDLESYAQVKKAVRKVRVKKAPSKEKLVAKVKYMKEDKGLKVVSVTPVNIIGAQMVWLFNTKTRKLYKVMAESTAGTLGIKGTTIIGYDEMKSVGKTVRKPEQTIPEFMKAGKVQLRKFLEDIKATEVKFNGRINEETLILKVQ